MQERYLFAVMLNGSMERDLLAIRKRYGIPAWEPKIGLHVTLVRPFSTGQTTHELANRAVAVAAQHGRFPLTLCGFGRFDNKQSVLYVRAVPEPGLVHLQSDLSVAFSDMLKPLEYAFTPHASISGEASSQQVDEYMRRVSNLHPHSTMLCDRFTLLRKDEVAREWQAIRDFPLR